MEKLAGTKTEECLKEAFAGKFKKTLDAYKAENE